VPRRRLDAELVRRGLVPSRERAAELIVEGRVQVAGVVADKPARQVAAGDPIEIERPPRTYVSRGGEKLRGALEGFDVAVTGRRALDAGASTGGFTDCLLQRGAARVVAVDVGYGQLHERIKEDERVDVRERTNARELDADAIGGAVDLVVADLSFISLRTVAGALVDCARPGADLVLLVKPQFEAGRAEASKGRGVIRDPEVRARAVRDVCAALEERGATIMGTMESPLTGADGNLEFFVHARKEQS
jgi:23S rRNA (cytidine1920-2'-O)/16S rRNA (cytidine1409-2'-O)-methyltransferase